jgi:hypothetical protein
LDERLNAAEDWAETDGARCEGLVVGDRDVDTIENEDAPSLKDEEEVSRRSLV